jgi:hypothetical protein
VENPVIRLQIRCQDCDREVQLVLKSHQEDESMAGRKEFNPENMRVLRTTDVNEKVTAELFQYGNSKPKIRFTMLGQRGEFPIKSIPADEFETYIEAARELLEE